MIEYESLAQSNSPFMAELEAAASRVIRSGWYVLGQEVVAFEAEFAQYVGTKYCIGVANGLDALILSIEALNLPKGSDILVASNTYIATILAIVRSGRTGSSCKSGKEVPPSDDSNGGMRDSPPGDSSRDALTLLISIGGTCSDSLTGLPSGVFLLLGDVSKSGSGTYCKILPVNIGVGVG